MLPGRWSAAQGTGTAAWPLSRHLPLPCPPQVSVPDEAAIGLAGRVVLALRGAIT